VKQIADGGPLTGQMHAPLRELIEEDVVAEDNGRYTLTAEADAILHSVWGSLIVRGDSAPAA
jgi:hypothetical protein